MIKAVDPIACKQMVDKSDWALNFKVPYEKILKDSDICFIALKDERLVHWTQISFKDTIVEEINKKFKLSAGKAYIFGVFTLEEYRNLGVTTLVFKQIFSYLNKRAITELFILTDEKNDSMKKILISTGFEKVGSIKQLSISGFTKYRFTGKIDHLFLENSQLR